MLQVAKEIWICQHQCVTKWEGSIMDYKQSIISELDRATRRRAKAANK